MDMHDPLEHWPRFLNLLDRLSQRDIRRLIANDSINVEVVLVYDII